MLRSLAVLAFIASCSALGCSSDQAVPSLDTGTGGNSDAGTSGSDASSSLSDAGQQGSPDSGASSSDASAFFDAGAPSADSGSAIHDECNPITQAGCMPPESKCIVENPTPMGGTQCVQPGNDVGMDQACTGGDCNPGLACVRTSTAGSTCQTVCDFAGGTGCELLGNDYDCRTRLTGTNWGACTHLGPLCDYITQAPCGPMQACGPLLRRTGQWEFRCKAAGTQAEGQSCGSSGGGDCQRGLVCIRNMTTGMAQCRKFCTTNDQCTAPETCSGSTQEPMFMYCGS